MKKQLAMTLLVVGVCVSGAFGAGSELRQTMNDAKSIMSDIKDGVGFAKDTKNFFSEMFGGSSDSDKKGDSVYENIIVLAENDDAAEFAKLIRSNPDIFDDEYWAGKLADTIADNNSIKCLREAKKFKVNLDKVHVYGSGDRKVGFFYYIREKNPKLAAKLK